MKNLILLVISTLIFSCNSEAQNHESGKKYDLSKIEDQKLDTATFAGGCFWCIEASFEQIKGVYEAVSGYSGGQSKNPTYREVSYGKTDHAETVEIYFDPTQISYETLLDIFFTAHDPTQLNRQGPDVGKQYRSAIFYHNKNQKQLAEKAIKEIDKSGTYGSKPVVTQLNPYDKFWKAEDYHQDYEMHHPNDPYIKNVSRPKIDKVRKKFANLLKY
ncbi:peptide-methionine (S)-S-oxide reductase MsrA [Marinigracilibium pacificum]|uniref:Peptide methionine sulfoxide reductase MsrA n=1 Tax=Marinigracilibium pacificum TaxID=2729599 RepID=A0A848IT06_9BACT|nr:peptide-methionine (S)-S-oxide reductase MsrA [Marinigracilibium pacificum]NMM47467.1 peptide-methionine (S)-S-oxide reductase MsrA [Marinigracilibium pacificum]